MPGDREQGKMTAEVRRGGGPRALATAVGGLAKRTVGKRGFAEAGLITAWEGIVGPELAFSCWPDRLTFPPGRRDGGSLRIRAAGGVALELQHMEPQLLERINGHFGYRAVERISIVNAPPAKTHAAATPRPKDTAPADPRKRAAIETAVATVEDPEIRDALARLGRAMISDSRGGREQ